MENDKTFYKISENVEPEEKDNSTDETDETVVSEEV